MSTLTTAQLLGMTRLSKDAVPPAGFEAVPSDRLALPQDLLNVRINYVAFFNPTSNELVITGTPRPMPRLDLVTQKKIEDSDIFSDTVRIIHGPHAGGFEGPPDPVTQTRALVRQLTDALQGSYPNATVSFAAEGAVGLAFSAASHALRNDSQGSVRVGSTVTLNAWTGHWTPDGSVDTGVLDVRTPHPANGDPGIGSLRVGLQPWAPGGVVAAVDTGNALRAGGLADIGTQGAVALAERVAGKAGGRFLGEGAAWVTEKLVGKGAEALKPHAADALASAAAHHVDSPDRAVAALGWQAQLAPADTAQVIREGIGQGQWNVMQGLSPAGHAVGGTFYEHTGKPTTVGTGPGAEIRQPTTQVTTWRDEATGAVMEARVSGLRMDDRFQADTLGAYAIGMDTAGRMVLKDQAAQRVADFQMRPAASTSPDRAASQDAAGSPVVVEDRSGLASYTTVSIQTHANGAASFDFVGEDGRRAWVMHDVQTGHRQVAISSAQEVAGEPRTVLYELDRNSHRVGPERYLDASGMPVNERGQPMQASRAAPAHPEPIPEIITHEKRITPTPGGMSFHEAHKRRDEPEQISPGSLQPVGKLDESKMVKGSMLYRMHQANEQDLMRSLRLAQAQDRERFGPQRPLVDRTQERAQEQAPRRLLEETPVQQQAEVRPAVPSVSAAQPAVSIREEHVAAPLAHTFSPGHANAAPAVVPNLQGVALEQRAQASAPSPAQPMTDPSAALAAAAQAQNAASQAQMAELQQRMARLEAQGNARDERERSEATRVVQGRDTAQHPETAARDKQASATATATATASPPLREFSDPSHPQNALYNTIKDLLPEGISPRWLAQATATCYMSNIKTPDDLGNVYGVNGTIMFRSKSVFAWHAVIEAEAPLQPIQQTMQEVQQHDQKVAQHMLAIDARNAAQANQQQQGPVMG